MVAWFIFIPCMIALGNLLFIISEELRNSLLFMRMKRPSQLSPRLQEAFAKAGISPESVRIYLIPSQYMIASYSFKRILIGQELLDSATDTELQFAIAHEAYHLAQNGVQKRRLERIAVFTIAGLLGSGAFYIPMHVLGITSLVFYSVGFLVTVAAFWIGLTIINKRAQTEEYAADRHASEIVSMQTGIQLLEKSLQKWTWYSQLLTSMTSVYHAAYQERLKQLQKHR